MGNPKVSVIIPVYKVEDYIDTCIDSLQKQTLSDLEFIFIDDCGGDRSSEIIQERAQSDPRIRFIQNERNLGAGKSRNKGIDAAAGEYMAFLDPDDWVDDNFYEVLYNRAKEGDYDIVKSRRVRVKYNSKHARRYKESEVNDRIKRRMSLRKPLYVCFTSEHQTAVFRTSMIQENHVYNGSSSHSENAVFLMGASTFASSFTIDSDVAYYYLQRDDSSVHTFDIKKFSGEIASFQEQMAFARKHLLKDPTFTEWLHNKLLFLLRRYDELAAIEALRYYRKPFFLALHEEIKNLPPDMYEHFLNNDGRQIGAIASGNWLVFQTLRNNQKLLKQYKNIRGKARKSKMLKKIRGSKLVSKTPLRIKPPASAPTRSMAQKLEALQSLDYTESGLAYIQNHKGCIVITKTFVDKYPNLACNYCNTFFEQRSKYNCDITSSPELLAEHEAYAQTDELCWRYVKRFGAISKAVIYEDPLLAIAEDNLDDAASNTQESDFNTEAKTVDEYSAVGDELAEQLQLDDAIDSYSDSELMELEVDSDVIDSSSNRDGDAESVVPLEEQEAEAELEEDYSILAMRGEIVGSKDVIETELFYVHPQEERRIIKGRVLKEYVSKMKHDDVMSEFIDYLNFLFERFDNGDGMLQGSVYDAFPFNCIVDEEHNYTLFDLEFEYKKPIDKGYMIYKVANVLGPRRKQNIYRELCEHFGIVAKWRHWEDFNFRNWHSTISMPDDVPNNEENVELFKNYFI